MNSPTLTELKQRHSVRNFTSDRISPDSAKTLKADITYINTHNAGISFTLIEENSEPFNGFSRSYGMFSGVRNYIVAVADSSFPDVEEKAGFYGEQLCMNALRLGLSTCFVGGTFSAAYVPVQLRAGQKILFLIVVGYAKKRENTAISGFLTRMTHRSKAQPEDFFVATPDWNLAQAESVFPFLRAGLEAVACAPSAMNRRPARITVTQTDDEVYISASVADMQQSAIDLGIAKYNFACAASGEWDWGNGARFYPSEI